MDNVREVTDSLLAEKPKFESALEELLEVDQNGPWTFDDVSLDSGTFGEVVSRGIVEETESGYRINDRAAVRAAIDGEPVVTSEDAADGLSLASVSLPDVDRQLVLAVGSALLFVAFVRIVFMWTSVFRGEHIVLAGNDPYYYRYWTDTLLASDLQAFDFGSLSRLPVDAANSDVLLIVVTWWAASLLGAGQTASGLVLAWYPVVAAIISAGLTYLFAVTITDDRRVGFAAVMTLAVTPAHAYRSALGFGDHHAFDFVWLGVVLLSLVVLVANETERSWQDWVKPLGVCGLGIGIAAQTMAWRGGPILLLPIGGYVILQTIDDIRAGRSSLRSNRWILTGLSLGGVLTLFTYSVLGWMELYRGITPALLAIGAIGLVVLAEGWHRLDRDVTGFSGVIGGTVVLGFVGLWVGIPSLRPALFKLRSFLTSSSNIAETQSLFAGDLGSIAGPILVFGLFLFLAFPYMAVATLKVYKRSRPVWLVPVVFAWYLFVLSVIKLRFTGEFSLLVSLFAGIGLVHLAEWVDLAREPVSFDEQRRDLYLPDRHSLALLGVLFLLFASMGLVQTPVKMSQIAIDDETYETAMWINEYAEQEGLEYPENYVFSDWGENRLYNYFANGESKSYRFARGNYKNFLTSEQTDGWAENKLLNKAGFVITESRSGEFHMGSGQRTLHERFGSDTQSVSGTGHYRAVYISEDMSKKVFRVVPGAHIIGKNASGETERVSTTVDLGNVTFDYERGTRVGNSGQFNVTVAYPGQYRIGNLTVMVSEKDVRTGDSVLIQD